MLVLLKVFLSSAFDTESKLEEINEDELPVAAPAF